MQLLRDNLTLWTSDMQGEGEGEKAEGDYISTLQYFLSHQCTIRFIKVLILFIKSASVRLFECLVDRNSVLEF